MKITDKNLIELFEEFRDEHLFSKYRFGNHSAEFYTQLRKHLAENKERNGCNQFLETEADYKIKLGGFLEQRLLSSGFTVHSEMETIYNDGGKPDLTVHEVKAGEPGLWMNNLIRAESLRCVIELKGANVLDPNYIFSDKVKQNVRHDLIKLSSLSAEVLKCLVILDEANGIKSEKLIKHFDLIEGKILILSNNPDLHLIGYC